MAVAHVALDLGAGHESGDGDEPEAWSIEVEDPLLAFGNAFEGSIHGYKFEDKNADGSSVGDSSPGIGFTIRS